MKCKCATCGCYVLVDDEPNMLTVVPCDKGCDFDVTFYHVQTYRKPDGSIVKEYSTNEERIL